MKCALYFMVVLSVVSTTLSIPLDKRSIVTIDDGIFDLVCDGSVCTLTTENDVSTGEEPSEETCTTDEECFAGENCESGTCVLAESTGDISEDGTCTTDDECPSGTTCDTGFCTLSGEPTCTTTSDCLSDETCDDGICVFTETDSGEEPTDEEPTDSGEEESDSCSWEGHCLGDTCTTDDECDNDWTCSGSVCVGSSTSMEDC